jgi:hypothetical protein
VKSPDVRLGLNPFDTDPDFVAQFSKILGFGKPFSEIEGFVLPV